MKVLFVDNFLLNFGIASLSSVLKQKGHCVQLLNYPFSRVKGIDIYRNPEKYFPLSKITDEIIGAKPDVIGFSILSANYIFYKRVAEIIRRKTKIPILVGGVLPTICPDLFTETACDVIFRGEAEPLIVELIEKLYNGNYQDIPNIVYRSNSGSVVHNPISSFVENLDALPFYDKELCPSNFSQLHMSTSRGCVFSCAYCASGRYTNITVMAGKNRVRKRSVDSVIREMKEALKERPYQGVHFWDDFFVTPNWLPEFAERYAKEIGLPYNCSAFPTSIDERTASLLAKSGCKLVTFGFQTANDQYKKVALKRNEPNYLVERALSHLRKYDVGYTLDLIINLPGETKSDFEQTLDFFLKNKIDWVFIYFLNYYPGSDVAKYAYENGYISLEQFNQINRNEMLGDQAYGGTIIDERKLKWQVQCAIVFRLINVFPGKWLKWILRNDVQKFFPTNRYFFYFLTALTMAGYHGWRRVIVLLSPYLPFLRFIGKRLAFRRQGSSRPERN